MLKLIDKIKRIWNVGCREQQIKRTIEINDICNHTIFNIENVLREDGLNYPEKELKIKVILQKYHKEYRAVSNPKEGVTK